MENKNRLATFVRLPLYQNYLRSLEPVPLHISSSVIATALGFGEVQVRKDLAAVCGGGRPRVGYVTTDLMRRLDDAMISRKAGKAVLIGAGKLGRALLDHKGFENYGMEIVAAFDSAAAKQGQTPTGKHIFPMEDLKRFCDKNAIRIGVLTVPAEAAQETADRLVEAGVSAIWCFAPARIELPEHVLVRYENLAASLAALSGRLDGVGRPVQSSLQQGKNLA